MALSYQLQDGFRVLIALYLTFSIVSQGSAFAGQPFHSEYHKEPSTMLPQLWFFAVLSPFALGVPVPRESVNPRLTPRYSTFNTKILNIRVNTGADSSRQWSRTSGQGSKIRLPNSLSTGVPGLSSGALSGEGFIDELKDGGFFSGGYGQDRGHTNIVKSGGTVHAYSNGNGADGASYSGGEGTRKASIHESTVGSTNTGSGGTTGREGTPGSNNTVAITQGPGTTVQGAEAEA